MNNKLLLVLYSAVCYSNGGLVLRLSLKTHSDIEMVFKYQTIWCLDNIWPFQYRTSSVFRSPLYSGDPIMELPITRIIWIRNILVSAIRIILPIDECTYSALFRSHSKKRHTFTIGIPNKSVFQIPTVHQLSFCLVKLF